MNAPSCPRMDNRGRARTALLLAPVLALSLGAAGCGSSSSSSGGTAGANAATKRTSSASVVSTVPVHIPSGPPARRPSTARRGSARRPNRRWSSSRTACARRASTCRNLHDRPGAGVRSEADGPQEPALRRGGGQLPGAVPHGHASGLGARRRQTGERHGAGSRYSPLDAHWSAPVPAALARDHACGRRDPGRSPARGVRRLLERADERERGRGVCPSRSNHDGHEHPRAGPLHGGPCGRDAVQAADQR